MPVLGMNTSQSLRGHVQTIYTPLHVADQGLSNEFVNCLMSMNDQCSRQSESLQYPVSIVPLCGLHLQLTKKRRRCSARSVESKVQNLSRKVEHQLGPDKDLEHLFFPAFSSLV